jgi:kumamolisin
MWAGYVALVNQQRVASGKGLIGFINSDLYAFALNQFASGEYATDYHDITSGTSGSFSAVTGFDLVTGWGSPHGQGLLNDLVNH